MKRTKSIFWMLVLGLLASPVQSAWAQDEQGDVRVTKAPALKVASEAEYTEEAIDNRIEGEVKLRLTIDGVGNVTQVELLEGLGYGLDESAIEAAKKFVFEPAEINGVPSAVVLSFVVSFELPLLPSAFTGKVVDRESGSPVRATIRITYTGKDYDPPPESVTMTTKDDGTFQFTNVPPGDYAVTLSVEGYDDFQTDILLLNGEESSATYSVVASPENLVGQIRESGTRTPLAAVRVELIDQASGDSIREAYTDASGNYGLKGVPEGRFTLRLSAEGYFTSTSEVEVKTGERTTAVVYVEKEYYDEFRVTTTERRARTEVNRQRLDLEEVRRIPGTGGDVVRVVQNLPGVARAPFVSGLIVVRGSAPQDTKIYLEGDNIPLVYHFFGGPAVINSEMIQSIDFYPGNFSTYYGRATGGVIDIKTRDPKNDRIHGMIDIDLLDTSVLIEGPITKDLSFAISGRRSYFDIFLPLVIPEDGPDVFVAPRYYDYQGWLTYKGFKNHKLQLFVYGSDDAVALILPSDEPQGNAEVQVTGLDLNNSFLRGQFRWEWRPDLPIENNLSIAYGVNRAGFEAAENFFFDLTADIAQIRNDTRLKFSESLTLRMGTDLFLGYANFSITTPRFEDDEDRDNGNGQGRPNFSRDGIQASSTAGQLQPAVYAEFEYRPFKPLLLVPGVRVDHFGQIAKTSPQPRISFRYDILDNVAAKGGVGLFTQPSTPGSESPEFGNPNLTFEKTLQYALGVDYRPADHLEFDATVFYRDQDDVLSPSSAFRVNENGQTVPQIWDNEGEGRSYGLELLVRHYPHKRFFGWLAYTLSRAERLDLKTNEFVPYQYDQTHILTLVGGYNLPYGFDVSSRFRLVTGAPVTPIIGGVYNSETDDYNPLYGERGSVRKDTFHQLDIRVDKKFVFDTWLLGFYLDVQNVYNASNQEGVRYNYDYTDSEPVTGLPILPTLGISAQF